MGYGVPVTAKDDGSLFLTRNGRNTGYCVLKPRMKQTII